MRIKITRKEAREHLEQFKLACELARLIRHFFPDLVPLLKQIPDPRNQSYITYPGVILLMTRILSSLFYIGSMRKTSEVHDHEACFYSYGCDHQECLVHIERYLKDSMENEKDLTWNRQMLKLIQDMIHENNTAPAEGMAEEKNTEFEARYDAVVERAGEEYGDTPPSDYYRDGYNLYLRMVEYKHNHLLFLSNPLVEPDNNLCERKARVLKGKINQAISLRSFEHLTYFCECLSVLDHFATDSEDNLYESVKEVFTRQKPIQPKSEKLQSANTTLSEYKAG